MCVNTYPSFGQWHFTRRSRFRRSRKRCMTMTTTAARADDHGDGGGATTTTRARYALRVSVHILLLYYYTVRRNNTGYTRSTAFPRPSQYPLYAAAAVPAISFPAIPAPSTVFVFVVFPYHRRAPFFR